jgi:hypothetical protein
MLLVWPRDDSYALQVYPLLSWLLIRCFLASADGEELFAQYGIELQLAQKERPITSCHWCSTSPRFTTLCASRPPLATSLRYHIHFRSLCAPYPPILSTYPTPISPPPTPSSSQRRSPMRVANPPSASLADTACHPTLSSACKCSDLPLEWGP